MKVGLLKKGFLSIALAVALIVSLTPLTALADDPVQPPAEGGDGYTFTLNGYGYGRLVSGVSVVCKGLTEGDIASLTIYEDEGASKQTTDTLLNAKKQYYLSVEFSIDPSSSVSKDNVVLMFDGQPCETQYAERHEDGVTATAVFKLPLLDATPFPVPFMKMFEQTSDIAPAEGSFELKVVKSDFEPIKSLGSGFTVKGLSFAAAGSHSFSIENNDFSKVLALLKSGIYVSEENLGAEGWSYDDAVWRVSLEGEDEPATADLMEESQDGASVVTHPLKFQKGKIIDGRFVSESQPDEMIFVNTYDPITSLTLPFVKKVTQGGTAAPGKEAFELEIFDIGNSGAEGYADVTYTAAVKTDGAGEFDGELTITGPASQIDEFVSKGFFVREVKGAAKNWTYSDAVWFVVCEQIASGDGSGIVSKPALGDVPNNSNLDDEVALQPVLVAYPTMCEVGDLGEKRYRQTGDPVAKMSFENVYTAAAPAPATLAKTGDSVNVGLLVTLLLVSGCVLVGAAYGARKKLVK